LDIVDVKVISQRSGQGLWNPLSFRVEICDADQDQTVLAAQLKPIRDRSSRWQRTEAARDCQWHREIGRNRLEDRLQRVFLANQLEMIALALQQIAIVSPTELIQLPAHKVTGI